MTLELSDLPRWLCPTRSAEAPAREVKVMTAGDARESAEDRAFLASEEERKRLEKRRRQRVARQEKARLRVKAKATTEERRRRSLEAFERKDRRRRAALRKERIKCRIGETH